MDTAQLIIQTVLRNALIGLVTLDMKNQVTVVLSLVHLVAQTKLTVLGVLKQLAMDAVELVCNAILLALPDINTISQVLIVSIVQPDIYGNLLIQIVENVCVIILIQTVAEELALVHLYKKHKRQATSTTMVCLYSYQPIAWETITCSPSSSFSPFFTPSWSK